MKAALIDAATGRQPAFAPVDQARFDQVATEAVNAGANKAHSVIRGGLQRGRSEWPRLSNWTMLLRIARGSSSNKTNVNTGDFLRSIAIKTGETKVAEVGILDPKGSRGQDLQTVACIMEGGATIKITEKMRNWFAAQGLHFKKSTTHIYIPPRPVFGLATPEMEDETEELVKPFLDKMEALFG